MADQNPPGSKPGRPFVPPFRGPASTEAPGAPAQPASSPSPSGPRPFVPPGARTSGIAARPPGRPPAPVTPTREPATPAPAPASFSPTDASAAAPTLGASASELPTPDDLAVEHAISETLGQGGRPSASLGLEVERASDPSADSLPSVTGDPTGPSTDLAFLSTIGEGLPDAAPVPSPDLAASATVKVVEGTLAAETARARHDAADEPPSSGEPLPWLAAPAEEAVAPTPRVQHEIATPTFLIAGGYDVDEMRRPTTEEVPGESRRTRPAEESTMIVGTNVAVAEALESVARRVREGELRVPAIDASAGEAGALAAALAVLLGVRS